MANPFENVREFRGDSVCMESSGIVWPSSRPPAARGCCHSKHTWNCCVATAVFGVAFLVLGVVVLLFLEPLLERKIEESMAIAPDSDRLASWLRPPLQGLSLQNCYDLTWNLL